MNTEQTFSAMVEMVFRPLLDEFGLELLDADEPDWRAADVRFRNETTGLTVHYEFESPKISVRIHRLIDGRFPPFDTDPHTALYRPGKAINVIEVEDLVALYEPRYKMIHLHKQLKSARAKLKLYLAFMQKYGQGLFRGDFSPFPSIERLLKKGADTGPQGMRGRIR